MQGLDDGSYIPRLPEHDFGYAEKRIDDQYVGRWETDGLPDDALITHVILIPYRGEKPVLTWHDGRLQLPAGLVEPGEDAATAIRRIAEAQTGVLEPVAKPIGFLKLEATTRHPSQAPGTLSYRVLYGVEVGSLADAPS